MYAKLLAPQIDSRAETLSSILPKTVREEAHEIMKACPTKIILSLGETKCLEGIGAFVDVGLRRRTSETT
jgi:hypothetical protein